MRKCNICKQYRQIFGIKQNRKKLVEVVNEVCLVGS